MLHSVVDLERNLGIRRETRAELCESYQARVERVQRGVVIRRYIDDILAWCNLPVRNVVGSQQVLAVSGLEYLECLVWMGRLGRYGVGPTAGIPVAADPGAIDINAKLPLRDKLLLKRISSLGTQGNIVGGSKQIRWIIDLLNEVERIEQSRAGSNPLLRRVIVEWIFGAVEQHLEALHRGGLIHRNA